MKKSLYAAAMCSALALSFGLAPASAQESVSASAAENGTLWFVELSGAPTADGNSLSNVLAEKAAFKKAAARAGVSYTERRSFDVLFNGYSVQVDATNRTKLSQVAGVKMLWPVETIQIPATEQVAGGAAPDLATAVAMTGADVAQNSLGLTGAGIKVAVMDTGVDYDHADLGGCFGSGCRVAFGYDLVGDAFNADPTSASYNPVATPDADPDDCNGHGTHVAGIVGANGVVTGVAPDVTYGAYRVFGCAGSTTSDIMISAMELALADGMHVLNMSIGSSFQWPQYPTAQASDRLVNRGVSVVASIGNSGANGLYAAGAPGVGKKVVGVASYDNTHISLSTFTISPDNTAIGYSTMTGSVAAPTSGSLPMARTGTSTSTADGCTALAAGSLNGQAALIRRGGCTFATKAVNAAAAGAAAVVIYNNVAGRFAGTIAGSGVTIPTVQISDTEGVLINNRLAAGPVTMTWQAGTATFANSTGGLISSFSSYGLAADLSVKPNIGAPGGLIYSTYPVELGSYATLSGTSMSSPHTAGGVALMLEANPSTPSNGMRARLQNSADPKNWWGNPGLGFLDNVHRQGAGMLDIPGTVQSTSIVEPSELALGESQAGAATRTLTIRNIGASAVTYDLSHAPSLSTGPNTFTPAFFTGFAGVAFSAPSVAVPAGGSATVDVTITANAALADRSLYGGYVVLTPQGGGAVHRVSYAGFKGDYQSITVLTPTVNGFPWLAQLIGTTLFNRPTGGTFTMAAGDIPQFVVHLDHQSRRVRFEAFGVDGKAWHTISNDEYVGRNSTASTFFVFTWNGTTYAGNKAYVAPNGQYVAKLSVLKALGDPANPAHWETWTSPVITIARP